MSQPTTDDHETGAPPETLIPLPRLAFHILLTLAAGDRHGYAIAKEVERNTGGRTKPSTGSLYLSMERLQQQGLIAESAQRPRPQDDDRRRRYFRITERGRQVARAEGERLLHLVELARDRKILGEPSGGPIPPAGEAEAGG